MHVALVTGANRGLGLETARQLLGLGWTVVVTSRSGQAADTAAAELALQTGGRTLGLPLDVTSGEQAARAAAEVERRFGRLDALVNNAGTIFDDGRVGVLQADPESVLRSFENNALGALRVSRALVPLMLATGGGNVVNVSTGMAGLAEMGGGWPGYRMSKAALNALTRILHAELHPQGIRVNSVCPGWVKTDMGGPGATRELPEGAAGLVWAATLPSDGPSGGFFRDGRLIPW